MKHGKKPSRAQKENMQLRGLNTRNWLVIKVFPKEFHIVHRETGSLRVLETF
ncbi:hypothetical protein A374_08924 [Fictibacillus macauensis ZFHKF-1]|uniref:DUF6906 domain-containing protein n=1 Tax=Fictibacillus macauensis ZFHKF-1 TaxID=1196324 RepID=I8J2J7_9BACL|nr:hypothetical protein [Fictibacillus macauensis]EIT85946.1 hypothetical protein A374_08924 [Fictibacillus macauensis ZFHKF-1]